MSVVKQSLITNAGNGVFATKNYKQGDFVCFYDCEERPIISRDDFIYSINNPFDMKKKYIGYKSLKNENGTGQFINDYSMFDLTDEERDECGFYKISSAKINNKINNYNTLSQTFSNVGFKNDGTKALRLYALKDINENDELYLHYGIDYWISKILLTTNEPFTRLYCLLKHNAIIIKNNKIYLDNKLITPDYLLKRLSIAPNGAIVKCLKINNLNSMQKIKKLIELIN